MENIEGKNYLTIPEVMERLKLSRSTVQRYVYQGKVEAIKLRGLVYITEESYQKLFIPTERKIKPKNSK